MHKSSLKYECVFKGTNPNKKVVEYMEKNYPPEFTYADFAKSFKAELFDPNYWADLIAGDKMHT